MENYQIFISYRRDGGSDLAGRLADRFKTLGYNVFLDVDSMHSGAFNTQILDAIEQCSDFLLVLSPNALDRCANEEDWVRRELEFALKHNKNIIPIIMHGFEFPTSELLPEEIDNIRYLHGIGVPAEYFDSAVKKIEGFLICAKAKVGEKCVAKIQFNEGSIKEGITVSEHILKVSDRAKYIVILSNNSGRDISAEVEANFYNNGLQNSFTKSIKGIPNKGKACFCFENYFVEFHNTINYKISIMPLVNQQSARDDIEYTYGLVDEIDGEEYYQAGAINLNNKGVNDVTDVTVGALIYKKGKPVWYEEIFYPIIAPNESRFDWFESDEFYDVSYEFVEIIITGSKNCK